MDSKIWNDSGREIMNFQDMLKIGRATVSLKKNEAEADFAFKIKTFSQMAIVHGIVQHF